MATFRYSISNGLSGCYVPDHVSGPYIGRTRKELAALIYTSDLMDKMATWKREILDALNEYYDATGEEYKTGEPGNFVWFAVEWRAHELANQLRSYFGAED